MTLADSRFHGFAHWLDAAFLVVVGWAYLVFLYPFLWWGDAPELVTAAWTNGVAHPTGYPFYLILLKPFLFLPLGSIAWRANLFSALATLIGLAFLLRLVPIAREAAWKGIGWRLGLAFLAFSPLLWEVSVLAEVYSLSFAFFAAILWAGKRWERSPTRGGFLFLSLLVGLAVSHHRLLGLMLPGLAIGLAPEFSNRRAKWNWIGPAILVFALAHLVPYLSVYLRAQANPPLCWEEPSNLEGLWNLFSASQFRVDQKIVRLQEWAFYSRNAGPSPWRISWGILFSLPSLWWDNLGIGVLLALVGAAFLFLSQPRLFWAGLVAMILPAFFLAQYHVADLEHFFLFPFLLVGLACAVGCGFLLEWASRKYRLAPPAAALAMAMLVAAPALGRPRLPDKVLESPERYARRTLGALPPGSLLLAHPSGQGEAGDYVYYPLLYMKEVARRGSDSALLSTSFLTSPWYRTTVEREGVPTVYFEDLVRGTGKVPVVDFDVDIYFKGASTEGESARRTGEYRFYRFENRLIGHGYSSFLVRLAESFFPHVQDRPLYATADWRELTPFLDRPIQWKPILDVPILTRGVPSLDGKPVPTGKLYHAEILDL